MSTKTRSFIVALAAIAIAVFAEGLAEGHQIQAFRLFWLMLGAGVASAMKVELPGFDGNMSVNLPFILLSAAKLSLLETLLIAAVCASVQMGMNKNRPTFAQITFNLSNTVVSAAGGFFLIQKNPVPELAAGSIYLRVALGAIAYCLTNTGLMAMVLKLVQGGSFREKWKNLLGITLPYYAVGGMLASLMSITNRYLSWEYTVLAIPVMTVIYWSYQQLVSLTVRKQQPRTGVAAQAAVAAQPS